MLVAYFDESGTHGDSRVVSVAGLIGNTMEWSRLELPWKKKLGSIKCFHATDCEHHDGNFAHLDQIECDKISADLSTLVAQRNLVAIGCSIYRDDWKYAASAKMKRNFLDPYHFCVAMVLIQTNEISNRVGGSEPVAFVFAKQEEYQDYSVATHEVFTKIRRFGNVGSLSFSEPECLIQLQAADLYSYENYRELLAQLDAPLDGPALRAPTRENLKTICRGIHVESRFFDVENLYSVTTQLDHYFS